MHVEWRDMFHQPLNPPDCEPLETNATQARAASCPLTLPARHKDLIRSIWSSWTSGAGLRQRQTMDFSFFFFSDGSTFNSLRFNFFIEI